MHFLTQLKTNFFKFLFLFFLTFTFTANFSLFVAPSSGPYLSSRTGGQGTSYNYMRRKKQNQ